MTLGTLYVVATPLGNLADLSERAKRILQDVALVAAEDTRRARILLQHVDARPRVQSLHAHSPESRLEAILRALEGGDDVAVVADAGTPTVSDPGTQLVQRARQRGARVVPVPGPSAVTTALSASGLPADRYTFFGFIPRKGAQRHRLIDTVAGAAWTSVLYEAPARLVRLLTDLTSACGGQRAAVVARELTKVHEEIRVGNLADLAVYYEENPPRGEVTLIVGARPRGERGVEVDEAVVRSRASELLEEGMSRRDAATRLAAEFSLARRETYRIVMAM